MRYLLLAIFLFGCYNPTTVVDMSYDMQHAGETYSALSERKAVIYAWQQHMNTFSNLKQKCVNHVMKVPIHIIAIEDFEINCSVGVRGCYMHPDGVITTAEIFIAPKNKNHLSDTAVHELIHSIEFCQAEGNRYLQQRSSKHNTTEIWSKTENSVLTLAKSVVE